MNFTTPPFGATGERLEVVRDYVHFEEGRAGEREARKELLFGQPVVSAEAFLSGFNMYYTRQNHDHEVLAERVDVWVESIGEQAGPEGPARNPNVVEVLCKYVMRDERTSDADDFNDCYLGFTVVALTRPEH